MGVKVKAILDHFGFSYVWTNIGFIDVEGLRNIISLRIDDIYIMV